MAMAWCCKMGIKIKTFKIAYKLRKKNIFEKNTFFVGIFTLDYLKLFINQLLKRLFAFLAL